MVIKNLYRKYKNIPEAVKASLFFTICSFVQKGIALLTTPIFTRILSPKEYGKYTIYQSWYAIFIILCTMYIEHGAFNTGVIKFDSDKKRFTSSLLGLASTITVVFFCFILSFRSVVFKITDMSEFMIWAMFLQILFVPAFSLWSSNERFNFRYKKLVVVTIIYAILNPILGIVAVYVSNGSAEARIASLVFIQILIGSIFYYVIMHSGKCFFDKKYWKYAIFFCIPMIPHYLAESILQQADRVMINNYNGANYAAFYSVAYTISMMVTYVCNAMNQSFMPYLYKSIKTNSLNKIKNIQKALLLITLAFCTIVISLAPEILMIFASKDYYAAVRVIPPVAMSVYFIFLYNHFCYVEMYYNNNFLIMIASVIAALINIVLNAIFIPLYGFVAAGYTTLISYMIFCFIHCIMYRRVCKKNNQAELYDMRFILLCSFIALIITICMSTIYKYWLVRYIILLIVVLIIIVKKNSIKIIIRNIKKD